MSIRASRSKGEGWALTRVPLQIARNTKKGRWVLMRAWALTRENTVCTCVATCTCIHMYDSQTQCNVQLVSPTSMLGDINLANVDPGDITVQHVLHCLEENRLCSLAELTPRSVKLEGTQVYNVHVRQEKHSSSCLQLHTYMYNAVSLSVEISIAIYIDVLVQSDCNMYLTSFFSLFSKY